MLALRKDNVELLIQEAASGEVEAQYQLGEHFRNRAAIDIDLEQAFAWYERAARQDHLDAQYRVGVLQLHGTGAHKNPAAAIEWLSKAAEQNHNKAQTRLAWCYQTGTGVEANIDRRGSEYRYGVDLVSHRGGQRQRARAVFCGGFVFSRGRR